MGSKKPMHLAQHSAEVLEVAGQGHTVAIPVPPIRKARALCLDEGDAVDAAKAEIQRFDERAFARTQRIRDGQAAFLEMKDELELSLDPAPVPIVAERDSEDALVSGRSIEIDEILAAVVSGARTQASLVYRVQGGHVAQAMGRNLVRYLIPH